MNHEPINFASMIFFAKTFFEKLLQWDRSSFIKVNNDWANPVFDSLMPFLRNSLTWIPLYLFLLVFALINFGSKAIWWCLFFISTVAITDMSGTYVFKHNVQRVRPCADPEFITQVRLILDGCGGYGFVSNHAANHFGMAAFIFITFRHFLKKWTWVPFAWAALIGYAQIYVGIHYPLDVLAGAMLGLGVGLAAGALFSKQFGFVIFDNQHQPVD